MVVALFDYPDKYLLGILLDGAGYKTAKTTRDREIAQINVLQGLGWRITRITAAKRSSVL